ncbi:energy-coupling factor transporter transmembrane protein EcfT [Corynebacterium aurimucosum]|uniref:Cobalt ABC transporter permease n=2 Tax=Corynebacterium TaxID=1716 RepID=A0ACC4U812_9CORY|nr:MULTISPECIES: energy-coupling factor transporter transmembrane protein EcfT [Corynebacterium]KKO77030.1 cobalt ABC transporter permease [Corynebacterium minutissimum]OFK64992.1 cobalt ABC transporter permease [Corynebacterium sp. HMSC074A09]OHO56114.1 cobalt ABC transporter permease [Corynebacterium sp. HMSC035E02]TVU85333.1 energy-coupling factor transporter transmembrane protein EcfT [Corynebacterium aurimucosum]
MPKNIPLGYYVDADTIIHRIPAAVKFLVLIGFILVTSLAVHTLPWAAASLFLPLVLFPVARIPFRVALGQLVPPLYLLVALAAFQWWQKDLLSAAIMFLTIYAAISAAVLLTLTTKVSEMMDSLDRALAPLGRLGIPVENITLAMSLTIRLLPLMLGTVVEVLDARKARGATASLTAFGTPVIIRSIRRARAMGEALQARGVGD